jgi:hypothetical protein
MREILCRTADQEYKHNKSLHETVFAISISILVLMCVKTLNTAEIKSQT